MESKSFQAIEEGRMKKKDPEREARVEKSVFSLHGWFS